MNILRSVLLAGSENAWLREQATRQRFVRRAVSRFMPGETIEEAIRAGAELRQAGLSTIFTELGEHVKDAAEADAVVAHYLGAIDRLAASGLPAEISVKLTQIGLDLGTGECLERARRIAGHAAPHGMRVWVDMENTPYTDRTLELYRALLSTHRNTGLCLQSYLRRSERDLEALLPLGPAIRMVKGAYMEPPGLAFAAKSDVDETFFRMCRTLLSPSARAAGAWLAVGTHDVALVRRVERLAIEQAIPRDAFEYAMLFGIQREEQLRLARDGWKCRVLVSYGSHWFPWYMRRLAERPANLWFVMKNMVGG